MPDTYLKQRIKLGMSEGQLQAVTANSTSSTTVLWNRKSKAASLTNANSGTLFFSIPDPVLWPGLELAIISATANTTANPVKVICENTSAYLDNTRLDSANGFATGNNSNYFIYSDGVRWRKLSSNCLVIKKEER